MHLNAAHYAPHCTAPCTSLHRTMHLTAPHHAPHCSLHGSPRMYNDLWLPLLWSGDEKEAAAFRRRHKTKGEFTDERGILMLAAVDYLKVNIPFYQLLTLPLSAEREAGVGQLWERGLLRALIRGP